MLYFKEANLELIKSEDGELSFIVKTEEGKIRGRGQNNDLADFTEDVAMFVRFNRITLLKIKYHGLVPNSKIARHIVEQINAAHREERYDAFVQSCIDWPILPEPARPEHEPNREKYV